MNNPTTQNEPTIEQLQERILELTLQREELQDKLDSIEDILSEEEDPQPAAPPAARTVSTDAQAIMAAIIYAADMISWKPGDEPASLSQAAKFAFVLSRHAELGPLDDLR